jgi:hypothetical protein
VRAGLHRPLGDLGVKQGIVHVDDCVMGALVRVFRGVDRRDDLPLEIGEGDVLVLGQGEARPHQGERRDEDTGQTCHHVAPPPAHGWLDDQGCSTGPARWECWSGVSV